MNQEREHIVVSEFGIGTGPDSFLWPTSTGAPARLDLAGLSMLQYPASEFEAGLTNLHLRVTDQHGAVVSGPLLGPASGTDWAPLAAPEVAPGHALVHDARVGTVGARVVAVIARGQDVLFWHLWLTNEGDSPVSVSAVATHDIALTPYPIVRINEYYVSQYLDLTPVEVPGRGVALAVRQNMPGQTTPWALLGSLDAGVGWATDARQLRGPDLDRPALDVSSPLPNVRLQHEHTLAALESAPLSLGPGEQGHLGFYLFALRDHPEATSASDASHAELALGLPEARMQRPEQGSAAPIGGSLFDAPPVPAAVLDDALLTELFGDQRQQSEAGPEGDWAWFTPAGEHVVLAAKERAVLRPHGHLLQTGMPAVPDLGVLTATVWMRGGFVTQLTRGHAGQPVVLSPRRGSLGLQRAHGLRMFVRAEDGWRLLDLPSAFALTPLGARWVYQVDDAVFQVALQASSHDHRLHLAVTPVRGELPAMRWALHHSRTDDFGQEPGPIELTRGPGRVTLGSPPQPQLVLDFAGDAPSVSRDGGLFADGNGRGLPWMVLEFGAGGRPEADLTVVDTRPDAPLPTLPRLAADPIRLDGTATADAAGVADLDRVLAWFGHDAQIHYLSPRGLEQFSGGAWGVRDVSQGPVGLLTAFGRHDGVRDVLLTVFSRQDPSGDWPQAMEFLPGFPGVYGPSHGDVVYWPLLALADHLLATGDASVLDEQRPMAEAGRLTDPVSITEHLRRAVAHIEQTQIAQAPLPAYGHGDWNDSLQPVDHELAAHMVSSWTAVLQIESLRRLAHGLQLVGREPDLVTRLDELAAGTASALQQRLIADGEVAGYGVFDGESCELLVHPSDTRTGLSHGILTPIHAIAGQLFTPDQARDHLAVIKNQLWGRDGGRLFDRPAAYRGGPMQIFKRAEAATFFGREIGLMYMHAHLRLCEALASAGDANWLWQALLLAQPIGLERRVPGARPRQSTTYYSSSDAAFADRTQAAEQYDQVREGGTVPLEGGWRVYSSGPGLFLRVIVESLLGVRVRADHVELDPVLPVELDGLRVELPVAGRSQSVRYVVRGGGHGVTRVTIGGRQVPTRALAQRYRAAGVRVELDQLDGGELVIEVGHEAQG